MGSCLDLREQMDNPAVHDAISKILSGGKLGYKTIIERRVEPIKCSNCAFVLKGDEKFCPECGEKIATKKG